MTLRPRKFGRVVIYALLLWIVGFIWGLVVFAVPALKNVPSVPYVSKLPAVSIVLIIGYIGFVYLLARTRLKATSEKAREGLKFGLTLVLVNLLLDLVVYFFLFDSRDYFSYLSIWFAYGSFIIIPLLVGRSTRT